MSFGLSSPIHGFPLTSKILIQLYLLNENRSPGDSRSLHSCNQLHSSSIQKEIQHWSFSQPSLCVRTTKSMSGNHDKNQKQKNSNLPDSNQQPKGWSAGLWPTTVHSTNWAKVGSCIHVYPSTRKSTEYFSWFFNLAGRLKYSIRSYNNVNAARKAKKNVWERFFFFKKKNHKQRNPASQIHNSQGFSEAHWPRIFCGSLTNYRHLLYQLS